MSASTLLAAPVDTDDDEAHELPAVRLGRHAIGLWRAAEELGDADLLASLRPLVLEIGRALAADMMSAPRAGTIPH
ncbi:hypothetical protein [Methylobacterium trifolii]|uniref:Uncharacterized protein n=1 Tax=Methylobacterium trifolii TaxID=1003092 RepID=A0ABQ4TW71_9HYPH|nr:hypothetical protein [Methylobacterium trifolii]GJE58125.1 hypothetical protein MPOCJGCO_0203 [Methylobacterium trifolii]